VVISGGALLFVLLSLALYRYLPSRGPGDAVPAPAAIPAGQEAAGGPGGAAVPASASPAPELVPLKRGLAEIERLYGNKMRFEGEALITAGPLAGCTLKTYSTGTAIDELTVKGEDLYKRSLAFNISEIEGDVGTFCSSVYLLALYPTAYDIKLETVPAEIRSGAERFGAKCARLSPAGGQPAEQYEIVGDYAFGCINPGSGRLKFEVSSESLFRAEKIGQGGGE